MIFEEELIRNQWVIRERKNQLIFEESLNRNLCVAAGK